jgi:hypothetical protein
VLVIQRRLFLRGFGHTNSVNANQMEVKNRCGS